MRGGLDSFPLMNTKEKIAKLIDQAVKENQKNGAFPDFVIPRVSVEPPEDKTRGDYATNVALQLAKTVKKNPLEVANAINSQLLVGAPKFIEKTEIAGPGFINFFLSPAYLQKQVGEILKKKEAFGSLNIGKKKKLQVEFISANPTGPLTVGNARGGFVGDTLANVLTRAGYKVEKAYYVNDCGMQILALGHSVLKDSEAVYKGDYIDYLNTKIKETDFRKAGQKAVKIIMAEMIKKTVKKMGIKYDEWISENAIHKSGVVNKVLKLFAQKGLTYEKDGALWFKATQFGDQRDRVVLKHDGEKTYLAGDAGLHQYKFGVKKFAKVINIWGADHFGDVPGLMAVVEALGHKGKLEIILLQFVTLIKDGQPFKMSKRLGTYVTVDELLELVNLDAARFFFLSRSPDTHLNFDINLAKEQSEKNPIFYIQYAHARICSILKKIPGKLKIVNPRLKLLSHQSEMALMKQLARFPEVVEDTVRDYQVQRLPEYAFGLATAFHAFYRDCRVISSGKDLTQARIVLVLATKTVLKNTLDLMGISSPEKM